MTWLWLVVIAIALIALTALLAAAEAALGSLSRADLTEFAEEARRPALFRRLAAAPEQYANATLFARIGLETIAAVLVTVAYSMAFENPWAVFGAAAGTMLLVSFLVTGSSPRSIGRIHPRATLAATGWLCRGARITIGPLADLLAAIGDAITPGRPRRRDSVTSERQLLSMVDEAAELDVLDADDRELIHSVFEFSDRRVREVMVARTDMVTVDHDAQIGDALQRMLDEGVSRAPVIGRDADDVVGLVYQKDLARRLLLDALPASSPVAEHLRPATFIPETLQADELLRRMQRENTHVAMVVDEYGGIAGLVTLEDVIEELVGEINDEYDRSGEEPEPLLDGGFRVSTRMATGELGELFDIDLEFDDVDSVGGLLAKELGKVPERGDRATVDGLSLVAERVGRRGRVTTVLVHRVGPAPLPPADTFNRPIPGTVSEALADRSAEQARRSTAPSSRGSARPSPREGAR